MSDLPPLSTYYTPAELDDDAFVASELRWYRAVFEHLRDRELERQRADQERELRLTDPAAADRWFGPAIKTSPAAAAPARRVGGSRRGGQPRP